jgi:hypothetical protein
MTISPKHMFYVFIAFSALILTMSHGIAWAMAGGNLLNLPSFWIDAYNSGNAAAFLTVDAFVVWVCFMAWVIGDAKAIGLGAKTGALFVALTFLAISFAFPLYLVVRERHMAKHC